MRLRFSWRTIMFLEQRDDRSPDLRRSDITTSESVRPHVEFLELDAFPREELVQHHAGPRALVVGDDGIAGRWSFAVELRELQYSGGRAGALMIQRSIGLGVDRTTSARDRLRPRAACRNVDFAFRIHCTIHRAADLAKLEFACRSRCKFFSSTAGHAALRWSSRWSSNPGATACARSRCARGSSTSSRILRARSTTSSPCGCEAQDPRARAHHELGAHLLLERADHAADGGLGRVERGGRPREVEPALDDFADRWTF